MNNPSVILSTQIAQTIFGSRLFCLWSKQDFFRWIIASGGHLSGLRATHNTIFANKMLLSFNNFLKKTYLQLANCFFFFPQKFCFAILTSHGEQNSKIKFIPLGPMINDIKLNKILYGILILNTIQLFGIHFQRMHTNYWCESNANWICCNIRLLLFFPQIPENIYEWKIDK